MNVVVKNIPEKLKIDGEIKFGDLLQILFKNNYLDVDFREVDDKLISQSMVDSIKDMKEEINKNGYKNFTSLSSN